MSKVKNQKSINQYKHVIFDFDGTIVDSYHVMIAVFNQLSNRLAIEPLSASELAKFRDMSPSEILKALDVPLIKLPYYLLKARKEYIKHVSELTCIAGIEDVLRDLSARYHFSIITSNDESTVDIFLKKHNIRELFNPIYSAFNVFSKDSVIQKLMNERNLDPQTTLYVGDEVRDIEASKKAGIDIISVSWGFNSANILSKHKPTYLIHKPEELKTIL